MPQSIKRNIWQVGLDAILKMSSTRANYWAEVLLDALFATLLMVAGWRRGGGPADGALAVALGLLLFSFIEYAVHRWVFHSRIPLFSQGHARHHAEPMGYDSLPFFLPGILLAGVTLLCLQLLPAGFAMIMLGTATYGYVGYGVGHFLIHHVRFRQPLLRRWAAGHHRHHYHPATNFGVTAPLWDYLLGTRYRRRPRSSNR